MKKNCLKMISFFLLSFSAFAGQIYHCGPLGFFSINENNLEKFEELNSTTNFLVIHLASSFKKGTAFFTLGMEYEGNEDALHEINLETQTGEKLVYSFSHNYDFGKILIPRNSLGKRSDYLEVEFINRKNKEVYSCFSTLEE